MRAEVVTQDAVFAEGLASTHGLEGRVERWAKRGGGPRGPVPTWLSTAATRARPDEAVRLDPRADS